MRLSAHNSSGACVESPVLGIKPHGRRVRHFVRRHVDAKDAAGIVVRLMPLDADTPEVGILQGSQTSSELPKHDRGTSRLAWLHDGTNMLRSLCCQDDPEMRDLQAFVAQRWPRNAQRGRIRLVRRIMLFGTAGLAIIRQVVARSRCVLQIES